MTKPTFETIRSVELPGLDFLRRENTLSNGIPSLYILAPDLTILVVTEIESGLQFKYWDSEGILYSTTGEGEILHDSWVATSEESALGTLRQWLRENE